jgi:hypothetical protein
VSIGEFNVCQFFADDSYEYVARHIDSASAVDLAMRLTDTLGARLGTTRRVIITDGGDDTNFEWLYGKGVTFPQRAT